MACTEKNSIEIGVGNKRKTDSKRREIGLCLGREFPHPPGFWLVKYKDKVLAKL